MLAVFLAGMERCHAVASSEIPPDTLATLQETFAEVRDRLWDYNDERWHRGEYGRCIALMRIIVEIDPHDVEAWDNAAWLMENALRDDEAEVWRLRGLAHNTDVYDLFFYLGFFYYTHQRYSEAVAYLEAAASFANSPVFVTNMLAHAYEKMGCTTEALNLWLIREAVSPNDPIPPRQIARILQSEPASEVPEFLSRMREQRLREREELKQ
jgi:tetratricopeptide (TPR) repeat protein